MSNNSPGSILEYLGPVVKFNPPFEDFIAQCFAL